VRSFTIVSLVRFSRAFRPPLPIQARTEGRDDGHQINHYILAPSVGAIDDFEMPPLPLKQRLKIAKAKTRRSIFVRNHDEHDRWISQEFAGTWGGCR
jgi:hypothetical protein